MSWLYAKQRAHLSSLTLSLIFIFSTLHNQISKPGPWLFTCCEVWVFLKKYSGACTSSLDYLLIPLLFPSVYLCFMSSLEQRESSFPLCEQGLHVQCTSPWTKRSWGSSGFPGPCLVRSFNAFFSYESPGIWKQLCWSVIQMNGNTTANFYALNNLHRSQYSKDIRVFSYWGSFPERRLFCSTFPSCAIFKLMTEIAICQIRDGLRLPSVDCFIWGIMQPVSVVAVQAELSHMAGEAEGLHAKEKQIPFSNRLKTYYRF